MQSISTESIEEGLDFACSLISDRIIEKGEEVPEQANQLLCLLANYNQFRYVGEPLLALHNLVDIGGFCGEFSNELQYWEQLKWIVLEMDLTKEEYEIIGIPAKFT